MLTAIAAGASHPAVAGLLGLGTAGLAGAVVTMAWSVHARQIRLAGELARRQFTMTGETSAAIPEMNGGDPQANGRGSPEVNGRGSPAANGRGGRQADGGGPAANGRGGRQADGGGPAANGRGGPESVVEEAGAAGRPNPAPMVIDGPDTVVAGEQARYRIPPSCGRNVVSWAVGGGSVAQSPDPAHPGELLLIADQPGDLAVTARVREGLTQHRVTKAVTAVPGLTPAQPVALRLFLNAWGLIVVIVLITGFAGALDALGDLSSADFIALVAPLAALLAVVAVARGADDPGGRPGTGTPRARP
jgi:hypothetical protein